MGKGIALHLGTQGFWIVLCIHNSWTGDRIKSTILHVFGILARLPFLLVTYTLCKNTCILLVFHAMCLQRCFVYIVCSTMAYGARIFLIRNIMRPVIAKQTLSKHINKQINNKKTWITEQMFILVYKYPLDTQLSIIVNPHILRIVVSACDFMLGYYNVDVYFNQFSQNRTNDIVIVQFL